MSTGLMSCVRENSPPMDMQGDAMSDLGPLSLPNCHSNMMHMTHDGMSMPAGCNELGNMSTAAPEDAAAPPNTEQHKRRRFHPLRNLRRIFRRRTITSGNTAPGDGAPSKKTNTLTTTTTTAAESATATGFASEKNLRSATLKSISSVVAASSPNSPLTQQQLQEAYLSQSLPKVKSYAGDGRHMPRNVNAQVEMDTTYTATASSSYHHQQMHHEHHYQQQNQRRPKQSIGVAVMPHVIGAAGNGRNFFAQRMNNAAITAADSSSQDLDGFDTESHTGVTNITTNTRGRTTKSSIGSASGGSAAGSASGEGANGSGSGSGSGSGEISDCQRSLSEGRLVDSDYSHDPLSQSHDSVFSESVTASSLSILKAELADVLRKRRNRPDASEEDLGLPRSPASPQRSAEHHTTGVSSSSSSNNNATHSAKILSHNNSSSSPSYHHNTNNRSDMSSLSLISINSTDDSDDFLGSSTVTDGGIMSSTSRYSRSSVSSTSISMSMTKSMPSDLLSYALNGSKDSTEDADDAASQDLFNGSDSSTRLSHAAAKHKMAIRPTKRHGPSRPQRKTMECSIPEANEEGFKMLGSQPLDITDSDLRAKTRSLPPSASAKLLEQNSGELKPITAPTSTPNDDDDDANIIEQTEKSNEKVTLASSASTDTLTPFSSFSASTPATGATAATLSGLRAFTTKAASIFESRESAPKPEDNRAKDEKTTGTEDFEESGFLRRLIQRNSKRSIAKVHGENIDSVSTNENEPKKLQIACSSSSTTTSITARNKTTASSSCNDNSSIGKYSAATERCYDQRIESDGITTTAAEAKSAAGLGSFLNSFMAAERKSSTIKEIHLPAGSKPKSGASARQRYIPQDIPGPATLERRANANANANVSSHSANGSSGDLIAEMFSTKSVLRKPSADAAFQSTSILRQITSSQQTNATKSGGVEHHYERKQKNASLLSAFEQKVSRSNDSFARCSTSNNSLRVSSSEDAMDVLTTDQEQQRQRKSVEKSRSFRTYTDDKATMDGSCVKNNMPSLPDLSINLRVADGGGPTTYFSKFLLNDKDYSPPSPPDAKNVSLGFEINDNNLVKPSARTESAHQLATTTGSSQGRNIVLTTSGRLSPSTQILASGAVTVAHLPSDNSCSKNISEIEQNIDLIVKSPFVSVLRKSTHLSDEMADQIAQPVDDSNAKTVIPDIREHKKKEEPTILRFAEKSESEETLTPMTHMESLLRDKSKCNFVGAVCSESAITNGLERQSSPVASVVIANQTNSLKTSRRASSMFETAAITTSTDQTAVPEFMKIQLNPVDPSRLSKSSNVVLAKNVKDMTTTAAKDNAAELASSTAAISPRTNRMQKTASLDELSSRRLSNDSVIITENEVPKDESSSSIVLEAVNKQSKAARMNGGSIHNSCETLMQAPLKSPVHKTFAISPPTSAAQQYSGPTDKKPPNGLAKTLPASPIKAKNVGEAIGLWSKTKGDSEQVMGFNRISLQERKRMFLEEEKSIAEKKIDEIRLERKKSIHEEVTRKSLMIFDEKNDNDKELEPVASPSEPNPVVVMRKKSIVLNVDNTNGNGNGNGQSKEDGTPELMKVFARRSLKIKDDDINALTEKVTTQGIGRMGSALKRNATTATAIASTVVFSNSPTTTNNNNNNNQNVDSDKENQSASQEKLDKISCNSSKYELTHELSQPPPPLGSVIKVTSNGNGSSSNSSGINVVPVNGNIYHRTNVTKFTNGSLGLCNGNNTNNNNNGSPVTSPLGVKSYVSPLRISGYRGGTVEQTNNNNNKSPVERQSLNNKIVQGSGHQSQPTQSSSPTTRNSGACIERSATVSEFKGIHQRRAEWEQRVKEALK